MPRSRIPLLLLLVVPLVLGANDGRDLGAAQPTVVVEGKRVALVIGNGTYQHAGRLAQAPADARVMAAALQSLGFEVIERYELNMQGLARAAADFDAALGGAAVGAFCYAGHAVQVEGKNFLVPVDADLQNPRYVDADALDMGRLIRTMDDAGSQLNLVVLDACRNNPWEGRWTSVDRALAGTRGLAQVNAPAGFIVAYATGPGDVAADNGVYAAALARGMKTPGLEILEVFRDVFAEVTTATEEDQVPWVSVAMSDRFYPAGMLRKIGEANGIEDACQRELAEGSARAREEAAAEWDEVLALQDNGGAVAERALLAWHRRWADGRDVTDSCGRMTHVNAAQVVVAEALISLHGLYEKPEPTHQGDSLGLQISMKPEPAGNPPVPVQSTAGTNT